MKLIKQVVGIDVAMDSLAVSIGVIDLAQAIRISERGTFKNTSRGFEQLVAALQHNRRALLSEHDLTEDELPLWFVMEASGVYYERLAIWLVEHGYCVSVALPNTIKAHAKSDNRKSKTDRIDADAITCYGLEKAMKPWLPAEPILAEPILAELKALVREHETLTAELTAIKSRIHAVEKAATTPKKTLKRLRQLRDLHKKLLEQIEQEIEALLKSDPELAREAEYLDSAPGVGMMTAATVLAETNRFRLIDDASQIVSYTGIDPKLRESGKRKGTVTISRKGNRILRHALYMPALTAIRCDPAMRALHHRITARTGVKMKGVVAVMRKLLRLMYTLWRKQERFDPNYRLQPQAA